MPAYVIANVSVVDPARYEEYKNAVPPTIAAHGGRYLARGGSVHVLEGDWTPERLVVLEFPTAAQAKAWWDSIEYAVLKSIRQATARTQLVIVEGLAPPVSAS
ncbi:MAG TPA: DUF1330 domain-containing protein [Candidatus Limnocylindria bacterium]|nr:DUF1330 domain-containing protein [Candidatus Limnocylindria bacterium]